MARYIIFIFAALLSAAPMRASDVAVSDQKNVIEDLKQRIEKLEGAPAKASLSSFNPAIGMALDGTFRDSNDKAGFLVRAAELNLEAPVDPYLKAWAIITASNGGVDLEEAALETTSLPYSLTVRGGRLFANFGRLAHVHDHELPVIERPRSLDTFVGGESQADGVEAQWLAPLPFFLNATLGVYNKMGADNSRTVNDAARPLDEFTYLGRLSTYADLSDSQSLELGADSAWTPKRTLSGVDLTYRYQPARAGLYKGIVWGTEVMQNYERRFDPATQLPLDRVRSYGGYSYVELRSGRHWRGGAMVDLTQDLDQAHRLTQTYTGFLTYDVTEFQRLRASYAQSAVNAPGLPKNHTVGLQWTGVFGHHVHGFRDR